MSHRILIAEPVKTDRVELERILTGEGYIVETVAEGGAVIDKVQTDLYDVLLLNLSIPARSGIDVLRIVQDTSPQTRIILLSAQRTFGSALKAIRTRVYDYLVTPVNRHPAHPGCPASVQPAAPPVGGRNPEHLHGRPAGPAINL